jgi:hypothetical protein
MRRHDSKFAIVITHTTACDQLADLSWLDAGYRIDESDCIHLSPSGWRSAAAGEPAIWDALERKLLIGFYVRQPELIAIVGHPHDEGSAAAASAPDFGDPGQEDVRRIARRVRGLLLPVAVLGFWTDGPGSPTADLLEHDGDHHDDDAPGVPAEEAEDAVPVA